MTALICGISSTRLTNDEIKMLSHPLVCGVILFKRNYQDYDQLNLLTAEIKSRFGNDFLITVDQEGGRVKRFGLPFTQLPALQKIGDIHSKNPDLAKSFSHVHAWLMATELLSVRVDMSFAPVLDIDNGSEVIGDRAFSNDIRVTDELAQFYCSAMQDAGMKTTAKHFPGHGTVQADSHFDLPIDKREFQYIDQLDLVPFKKLIYTNKIIAVMMSHVIYEKCCELPAGYSKYWCQNVLRKKLNFRGIIISDDLGMKAADCVGDVQARYQACIDSGVDIALACTFELSQELLESHSKNQAVRRYPQLVGKSTLPESTPFWQSPRWQAVRKSLIKIELEASK